MCFFFKPHHLQVDIEDKEWEEEFLNERDPSILHFLVASGDDISSKQLRDDLMTLLIAGHETTAAVLTWTVYCLSQHPDVMARLQAEVCCHMLWHKEQSNCMYLCTWLHFMVFRLHFIVAIYILHYNSKERSTVLQVDTVLGDRKPTVADMGALRFTTRVINESMRLYPQPPVLIRRALEDDVVGGASAV